MIDSVSDVQLPFIEIQHNKIKLAVNLENCLLSSDLKYSEIPELHDTLMVWGEVDKVSLYDYLCVFSYIQKEPEQPAFNGDNLIINALFFKICNGLNITSWSNAINNRE